MPSLIDRDLTDAVYKATDSKRQAIRNILDEVGDAVGDVGGGLVDRKQELELKRSQLKSYQDALEKRKATLEEQRNRFIKEDEDARQIIQQEMSAIDQANQQRRETGEPLVEYPQIPTTRESIARDAQRQNLEKRIGEIGEVQSQMPVIGDMNFINFRRVQVPTLPERQDIDYSPKVADLEAFEKDRQLKRQEELELEKAEILADVKRRQEAESKRRWEAENRIREAKVQEEQERYTAKMKLLPTNARKTWIEGVDILDTLASASETISENAKYIPAATKNTMDIIDLQRQGTTWADIKAKGLQTAGGFTGEEEIKGAARIFGANEGVSGKPRNILFGVAMNEGELKKAEANLPAAGDSKELLEKKYQYLYDIQKERIKKELDLAENAGYDVTEYRNQLRNYERPTFSTKAPTKEGKGTFTEDEFDMEGNE